MILYKELLYGKVSQSNGWYEYYQIKYSENSGVGNKLLQKLY